MLVENYCSVVFVAAWTNLWCRANVVTFDVKQQFV